ncbi:LOW QUALITY PROTEIN: LrgA-associated membrane protein LrgB [Geomicrobium sp. JCM 19055]|nr:LOW QUALITY PROTEIN: LrgA-associated membrane protein LrgB [Geomicrobium sp. JCM 19055]
MSELIMSVGFIAITLLIYMAARKLNTVHKALYTMPFLTGTIVLVMFLIFSNTSYEAYSLGGAWIEFWLGPAIVALSIPLYEQRKTLLKFIIPLGVPVILATFLGIVTGVSFAGIAGLSEELMYSILPKSVTTPIAMDIASILDGDPSIAALLVLVAGVSGVLFADITFRIFKIDQNLAKGIGLGAAAHGIGTANAMENGQVQGAASSVSMTLCAILLSIFTPIIALVFMY